MNIALNVLAEEKVTGLILYKGPSEITGDKIVVIATGLANKSDNLKTGKMIQIWILSARTNPIKAYYNGLDTAVCGDCKHSTMGTCYVNLAQGPYSVFGAYRRGVYTVATPELVEKHLTGKNIRFGAYGDPAAVPMSVIQPILDVANGWTAYTHQWRKPFAAHCKSYCMASVDNVKEYDTARAMGWRTFRLREANEPMQAKEFSCPASIEAGKRLSCEQCKACDGNPDGNMNKGTVSIIVHGTNYKPKRFIEVKRRKEKRKGWSDLLPPKLQRRAALVAA